MRNPKTGEQYSVWVLNHCDEFVPWDSVEFDSAVLVLEVVSPYKGYKFWFELFEDISGLSLTIWYPMNAKKGEEINVKIQECYTEPIDILWTHGNSGLTAFIHDMQMGLDDLVNPFTSPKLGCF